MTIYGLVQMNLLFSDELISYLIKEKRKERKELCV